MNIVERSDEEIRDIADPLWRDLLKSSNEGKYEVSDIGYMQLRPVPTDELDTAIAGLDDRRLVVAGGRGRCRPRALRK